MLPPFVALAVRPRPGVWEYLRVNVHMLVVDALEVPIREGDMREILL